MPFPPVVPRRPTFRIDVDDFETSCEGLIAFPEGEDEHSSHVESMGLDQAMELAMTGQQRGHNRVGAGAGAGAGVGAGAGAGAGSGSGGGSGSGSGGGGGGGSSSSGVGGLVSASVSTPITSPVLTSSAPATPGSPHLIGIRDDISILSYPSSSSDEHDEAPFPGEASRSTVFDGTSPIKLSRDADRVAVVYTKRDGRWMTRLLGLASYYSGPNELTDLVQRMEFVLEAETSLLPSGVVVVSGGAVSALAFLRIDGRVPESVLLAVSVPAAHEDRSSVERRIRQRHDEWYRCFRRGSSAELEGRIAALESQVAEAVAKVQDQARRLGVQLQELRRERRDREVLEERVGDLVHARERELGLTADVLSTASDDQLQRYLSMCLSAVPRVQAELDRRQRLLMQRLSHEAEARRCLVCEEADISVVLLPCRHSILCHSCSNRLTECPLDRTLITERLGVYGR